MHTLVGGITSGLVGGNFTAGALPAGINEAAMEKGVSPDEMMSILDKWEHISKKSR